MTDPQRTPDGRYLVVRGRLWRATDPSLDDATRERLTGELMAARRAKQLAMRSGDEHARREAMHEIEKAKRGLGERGPVWWDDGAPDYTRRLLRNTPYAHETGAEGADGDEARPGERKAAD